MDFNEHREKPQNSFTMLNCECGRKFSSINALNQHRQAKHSVKPCLCSLCNRRFKDVDGLRQHNLALHQQKATLDKSVCCEECHERFPTASRLATHQKQTGHCYCQNCKRYFHSSDALREHFKSPIHVNQFHCCDCNRDFKTEQSLEQHLAHKVHSVTRNQQPYCECHKCNRVFKNGAALQKHLRSVAHNPLSKIKCIAERCTRSFTTPSAFLHHLESGACRSGMDRHRLNALIIGHDLEGLISSPREITGVSWVNISGHSLQNEEDEAVVSTASAEEEGWEVISMPDTSSFDFDLLTPPPSTQSNSDSSSLSHYLPAKNRCPMCPPARSPFRTAQSLQQHLLSAAHDRPIFHCPLLLSSTKSTPKRKRKSFSTVSGLAQHLESGSCQGGMVTFRKTVEYVEAKLRELGWTCSRFLS